MTKNTKSNELILRDPSKVMRLERMGSSFQTRLSFMRTLIRRMSTDKWRFERLISDIDSEGYGVSVYAAHTPERTYSLVAFTQSIPNDMRTDRVIAEVWDATFSLYDGVPSLEDIEYLSKNTPKQEAGRFRPSELVLARANKSLRLFEHIASSLSNGEQPDIDLLASVGYLMRTTAVYGSGKFGCADRAKLHDREECKVSFHIELLAVYLIRWFTIDLVETIAQKRGGKKAVKLEHNISKFIGVGNSTGLGMAPFLLKHPVLIHNWVSAKESSLGRVRSINNPTDYSTEVFLQSLKQASQHIREWNVEDEEQTLRIERLRVEVDKLEYWCVTNDILKKMSPWDIIYKFVEENFSYECQELTVSLLLEPHGELIDELADTMLATDGTVFDSNMQLKELTNILNEHYSWATKIDFSSAESQHHFWYYSEDKLEPRFGSIETDDGVEQEMPLAIAREISELHNKLETFSKTMCTGEFAMRYPQFRHIIRRAQNTAVRPYAEVQDNLLSKSMRPLDLLRFKLAFFGASKFDPKSDLWTRISMYQGAPLPKQLNDKDHDNWAFPIKPIKEIR